MTQSRRLRKGVGAAGIRRRARQARLAAWAALLLAAAAAPAQQAGAPGAAGPEPRAAQVRAAFGRDCEGLLLAEIGRAERSLAVAIHTITRRSIADALIRAAGRGVKVSLKYDARSSDEMREMAAAIRRMRRGGVDCAGIRVGGEYGRMHHKFAVVDGTRVLTGSFNFTTTASTKNYENLLCIESADIAGQFVREFEGIRDK